MEVKMLDKITSAVNEFGDKLPKTVTRIAAALCVSLLLCLDLGLLVLLAYFRVRT